ncbi:glycosyltransferase [Nocardioides sp. Root140]|uniref:glycosyltransferase n=1 Tax=Nocardioides sp. Root140 TaxID=1736460 RepID=UPI0006F22AD6|nr:glycosyltransferase [Nocardioides sp. Root140]KQY64738.1 glycosyl transferase [Nocardioides sp. Root140]
MRILFTFIGGQGHFWPLVPIARAAEAAGHTVAVAGSGKLLDVIHGAGFTAFGTSDPHPPGGDPNAGLRDDSPLEPADREAAEREFADNFAGRGARRHATALREIIGEFVPDVVVRDEADFGSAVAAERCGVPCATVLVLASGALLRRDLVAPVLDEVRAEHGLPADPGLERLHGALVLSPFLASLRHPEHPLPADAFLYRPGDPVRVRVRHPRPQVYFTLGTVMGGASGDLIERVLAGLSKVDADVVVTVGSKLDPASFGPQPPHVRIERFVPQARVLPTCDLVISHGGSGSLMGALSHGLPSVLLPLGADQPHNAEQAVAMGVAVELDAVEVTASDLADTVDDVLNDDLFRSAAQRVQAEVNALPPAAAVVPLLEDLGR